MDTNLMDTLRRVALTFGTEDPRRDALLGLSREAADLEAKLREAEAREEAARKALEEVRAFLNATGRGLGENDHAYAVIAKALSLPASDHDARVKCDDCDNYAGIRACTGCLGRRDARVKRVWLGRMVDRFLSWPLPKTVHPDPCVMDPEYPHRIGTNLLTADEARQMLEHMLAAETSEDAMTQAEAKHEARVEALREEERDALRFARDGDAAETKETT